MDSAKLSIAVEFIENRLPDAYSLLVVKNGYLILEKYFRKGDPDRYAVVHSEDCGVGPYCGLLWGRTKLSN
jgi:hypothetical protein